MDSPALQPPLKASQPSEAATKEKVLLESQEKQEDEVK